MKRFRVMAAALCAVVLLCGFSVPAYAYADGGEGADYGDPTMTEEAPAPEPTIEPGEGFSEDGSLVTRDLLYDEHTNKQFITVQTSGGNTFYIVIDYDKPVDEEGEQYETYFFSVVDEADLLAAAEAAGVEQAVCSCSEKCEAGAVNTDCAVCSVNMSKCVGVEPEPEPTETEEPAPEEAGPETGGNMGCSWRCWLWPWWAAVRRSISRCCAPNSRKPPRPRRTTATSSRTMTSRTATGTRTMTARPGTRRTMTERRLANEVYQQPL